MTDGKQDLTKKEASTPEGVERTRPQKVYTPDVDIIEQKDEIIVTADLPGVDDKSLDITLEKNVLTIHGRVEPEVTSTRRLIYSEYGIGDYQRAFTLSDEVDKDKIQATMKNGVLRLVLPKATAAKTRKIAVTAEV
jgi:HSP20 family protein